MRPLLTVGRLLALALLIIGLARPQLAQAKEIVHGEGVDIVIAQDISGSMASLDFQPQNRLEAAKAVVDDFISRRTYDRIGLVVFAHEAFSQSPMTTDHAVLNRLLKQVQLAPDLRVQDGTAIGLGLANAANMLKDSKAKSRVVILLTDGANNAGEIAPETAAEAAQALGIKVYTIGMGRTGQVPVPVDSLFGGKEIVYHESDLDEGSAAADRAEHGRPVFPRHRHRRFAAHLRSHQSTGKEPDRNHALFRADRIDDVGVGARAGAGVERASVEPDAVQENPNPLKRGEETP